MASDVITAAVAATGTITFIAANPVAGDTITVNGVVYTIAGNPSTSFDVDLIGAEATEAANFAAAVNAEVPGSASTFSDRTKSNRYVRASVSGAVVTLTALVPGAVGNAITLAESGTGVTVSGAALTGGLDVVIDPRGLNFVLNARGTDSADSSNRGDLGVESSGGSTTFDVVVLGVRR